MTQPPDNYLTPQDRTKLTAVVSELQNALDDTTPFGLAIKQRDHWAMMWDNVMQEVLRNLEQVRDEQRRIRTTLADAAAAGSTDTERITSALKSLTDEVVLLRSTFESAYRNGTHPSLKPRAWWKR